MNLFMCLCVCVCVCVCFKQWQRGTTGVSGALAPYPVAVSWAFGRDRGCVPTPRRDANSPVWDSNPKRKHVPNPSLVQVTSRLLSLVS